MFVSEVTWNLNPGVGKYFSPESWNREIMNLGLGFSYVINAKVMYSLGWAVSNLSKDQCVG